MISPCPWCGKLHHNRPDRCLSEAAELHTTLCGVGANAQHRAECRLKAMREYLRLHFTPMVAAEAVARPVKYVGMHYKARG